MTKPATENSNPNSRDIDLMNSLDIVSAINNEDKKIAQAIEKVLPHIAQAVDLIVDAFNNGGRMAYFGAVTSGRIAVLDAADCAPTFGIAPEQIQAYIAGGEASLLQTLDKVEDSAELAIGDINTFNPKTNDVVVSISASGNPQYAVSILEEARKRGAKTIAVTSNPNAQFKPFADIFINPILGQEVISGSSRMKSGTAQKMILNMLSTATMVRLGKTYRNMMVDVSITNQKLHNRAVGIISEIAGVDEVTAEQYLHDSGNNVKTACVMAIKKCNKTTAKEMLHAAKDILRKTIE